MAVSVGTMQLTLSIAIMQVTSVAIMQVLRFYYNYAGGTFCYSYVGGSFCCNYPGDCFGCNFAVRSFCSTYAGDSLCGKFVGDNFIVIMQVGVSVATMQLVCSVVHYAYDCFY